MTALILPANMTYSAIPSAVQNSAINTQISDVIRRLRQLNQLDVQVTWRSYAGDLPVAQANGCGQRLPISSNSAPGSPNRPLHWALWGDEH